MMGVYGACLAREVFPRVWKEASVRWLPKKSGGHRPISLLPTLGKLLDRLVNARLVNWYKRAGCLNERQFGFLRSRDTIMAIERMRE